MRERDREEERERERERKKEKEEAGIYGMNSLGYESVKYPKSVLHGQARSLSLNMETQSLCTHHILDMSSIYIIQHITYPIAAALDTLVKAVYNLDEK